MGKELELAIKIGGRLDKSLGSAVNNAQKQLNSISKVSNKVGMAVTAGVITAGTKLVVDSVNTYKSYQSALNSAAATAGIERGTAEYEAMNAAAREAGRTTVKTAEESANALEYMALAGWSVEDSTKALMPVLKLSAATGAELAITSDLVTDSMANLGLGINDLNHYLDVSATANNKSNQTAMQLQEAYLGVGGVLKNLNSPIEESAAVLGVLANRGTKGSEAGTALNAILVNMQKRSGDAYKAMSKLGVSMYDSGGKARSIIDVFQEISDKTSGMTEENRNLMYQMIGGKSHLDSFAKIMQGFTTDTADGTKEIYSLINAFNNCDGALDKLYGIKTDTLEGSILTLNSAFDDMKISIGEKIAPTLNDAVKNLTAKMPDIENVIVNSLERIIPAMSKVIGYIVDNSDKIISTITGIAKAFIGFKITTGTAKGINSIVTLGKNLSMLKKAVGGSTVIKGVVGTFTGVGAAAETAGGTIISTLGGVASGMLPVLGILGAIAAVGVTAYTIWDKTTNHWADGVEKASVSTAKYADKIQQLNSYQKELGDLDLVINNPESSAEEINTAKQRINEIAALLEKEYGLTINTDNTNLNETLGKVQEVVKGLSKAEHSNFETSAKDYISEADKAFKDYSTAKSNIGTYQNENDVLKKQSDTFSRLQQDLELADRLYDINGDIAEYQNAVYNAWNEMDKKGLREKYQNTAETNPLLSQYGLDDIANADFDNIDTVRAFGTGMQSVWLETENEYKNAQGQLTSATNNINKYETAANNALNAMTQVLQSDVLNGNSEYIQSDIELFNTLYKHLDEAGANVDGVVQKYALAKNGFSEVTAELTENDEAINNIIADIKSFGDMQGMFDGLDSSGVADKLTDMAHAMNLIPENKSISIDANGNFEIIAEAENQIASLRSQGNVDLYVNANGDLSIYNEATQQAEILKGIGAVSLSVNADGNIDVLNQAQEKIATIDKKTGKPTLTATDNATSKITSVSNKLSSLNGKTAKTTIITEYKQKGKAPAHNAAGTSSWRGGLTYVNDQNINDPREVIEHNGMRYWYEGKNILANIPRGAKIYNALRSRAFINGSHRNGLERVPFDGYIAELHAGERVLTDTEANNYRENGLFAQAIERLKEFLSGGKPKPQDDDGGGSEKQFVFSPTYQIYGNADQEEIREVGKRSYKDFVEFMERYERDKRRKAF